MIDTTSDEQEMGRVIVKARFENLGDILAVREGPKSPDQVRKVRVDDALVDTSCTLVGLPTTMIRQLGLTKLRQRRIRSATGIAEAAIYSAVRWTIQDRDCTVDAMEVPEDCPVLIGQVPLEILDFVVSPGEPKLIGNPAHGGEQMLELYSFLPPAEPSPPAN